MTIKKQLIVLALALIALVLGGCNNPVKGGGESPADDVSIIRIQVGSPARSAYPSELSSSANWYYEAKAASGTETVSLDGRKQATDISLVLKNGVTWTITLTAYAAEMGGDKLMEGSATITPLAAGTVFVPLKPVGSGNGSIALKINIGSVGDTLELESYDGNDPDPNLQKVEQSPSGTWTFKVDNATPGIHTAVFTVKQGGTIIGKYLANGIVVYPGMKTNTWYKDDGTSMGETLTIKDDNLIKTTDFFVASADAAKNILNVAGDDGGNGSIAKPFLTLNKAWEHCTTLDLRQEITIYIDGEVKGFFLNTGEANDARIKFKGLSGDKTKDCMKKIGPYASIIHSGYSTNKMQITLENLTIDGSPVNTNDPFPENGGGIYFNSNGTLTLNNVTIQNCNATEYGGGVYLINGSLSMNTVEIKKCTASNSGGIYFKSDKQCILNSCTINECNSKTGGSCGGIYLEGTAPTTATIKNSTIKDCKSDNPSYRPDGGGIHMTQKITVTINNTTISGCEGENGGGIYIYDGATLKADNLRIESCKVRLEGGGIKVSGDSSAAGGTVTLTNSNILNCEAGSVGDPSSECNGGGVYIGMKSSFTMNGGSISNNKVTRDDFSGGNGGGVYVSNGSVSDKGGSFTMENGSISGNNAKNDGGGIYFASKETLTLANVEIKECVAKKDGGGIFFNEGKGTATNLTVTKCKADKKGGGILIRNSSGTDNFFILEGNSSIKENELTASNVSDRSGTGVYVGALNDAPFKIKGDVQIGTFGSSQTLTDANDVYLIDGETIYIDKNENLTKNPVAQITPEIYGPAKVLSDDRGGEDIKINRTKFTVTPDSTTSPPTKYTIAETGKLQTTP
ncbi:right-handed parallel beta-helix repeat-containing protein [Treponema phagedenis]|uniref:right-handed parallel beta-helix repeat-containing protein n=1 Tax=Treponema phagedenis TaxID=162 RepID=UPI0001F6430E|nr:right-handed parallel beta-helix repeat-containing protein [Treponema phagedenis]EFW38854.1 hypothetical protein HMPREF9554_00637 [Treponema phagedenis F0421]TYT78456.1 hypothetical protein FS559_04640 [Treponema phagedenis]